MAGVEITWNGTSSSTIPGLVFENPVRQMLGTHRGSFLDIPGRRGSWYYPDFRGRRSIKVPGFILAETFPTGRRDAIAEVQDWLDVDIEARLILGDDPSVYYEAVLGDCGDATEWRQLGQFEAEWIVQPTSYAMTATEIHLDLDNDVITAFDPDLLTTVLPVIEIKPTNGTLLGFTLSINDTTLSWDGTILSGSTLTINAISAVVVRGADTDVQLTGVYDPAQLAMTSMSGSFPYLQPGVNTFHWVRTAGTATDFDMDIIYRKAYRR